jgi:hypothetical protein
MLAARTYCCRGSEQVLIQADYRLDRIDQTITTLLAEHESTVLSVCSVIGKRFDQDILLAVLRALPAKAQVQRLFKHRQSIITIVAGCKQSSSNRCRTRCLSRTIAGKDQVYQ